MTSSQLSAPAEAFRAYSSQVADLLERAYRWPWDRAGLTELEMVLADATAALACHDSDAMRQAATTLGALVAGSTEPWAGYRR